MHSKRTNLETRWKTTCTASLRTINGWASEKSCNILFLLNYLASIDKISKLRNCVSQSMITKISIWILRCVSFIWNVRVHGWVPSLQIKCCLYVNTITKGNSSVGRSKTELQQKSVPLYYWWNILDTVPTRPKQTNNFHVATICG